MDWRKEYKRLYKEYQRVHHPVFFKDFPDMSPRVPVVSKANGLTMCIINWLTWSGFYANRISTQGQARKRNIPRYSLATGKIEYLTKMEWTKGNTRRGTPDITAIVHGRAIWIEVKVGKDRMSDHQRKEQGKITDAGGLYFIAHDMQSFVDWFYLVADPDPELFTTPEGY